MWKQGRTLGLVNVSLQREHLVLGRRLLPPKLLLLLLPPLLLLLLTEAVGDAEWLTMLLLLQSVWSISDPSELAPFNDSSEGVGEEAIFSRASSLMDDDVQLIRLNI